MQIGQRTDFRDQCLRCDCPLRGTSTPGARRECCECQALGASTSISAPVGEIATHHQDQDHSGLSAAQTIQTPLPSQTATGQGTQWPIPTRSGRLESDLDDESLQVPSELNVDHRAAGSGDVPCCEGEPIQGRAASSQLGAPVPDRPAPTGAPLALGGHALDGLSIAAPVITPSFALCDSGSLASMTFGHAGDRQWSGESICEVIGAAEAPHQRTAETTSRSQNGAEACLDACISCSLCGTRIYGVPTVLSDGSRCHFGCAQRRAEELAKELKELEERAERRHERRQRRSDHAARWRSGRPKRRFSSVSSSISARPQWASFEAADRNDMDLSGIGHGKPWRSDADRASISASVATRGRVRVRIPLKRSRRSAAGIVGAGVVLSIAWVLLLSIARAGWLDGGRASAWKTQPHATTSDDMTPNCFA